MLASTSAIPLYDNNLFFLNTAYRLISNWFSATLKNRAAGCHISLQGAAELNISSEHCETSERTLIRAAT
jgi:hypothetical protein